MEETGRGAGGSTERRTGDTTTITSPEDTTEDMTEDMTENMREITGDMSRDTEIADTLRITTTMSQTTTGPWHTIPGQGGQGGD